MPLVLKIVMILEVALFAILIPFFLSLGITELATRIASRLAELSISALPVRLATLVLAIPKFLILIFTNIRRNILRSALAYLAVFVMVFVITLIWSILGFLDAATSSKAANFKALVTEKFQLPSQMPPRYEQELTREVMNLPADIRPDPVKDVMSWSFVGTALDPDPAKRSLENILFFFAMDPRALLTMMDDLEQDRLPPDEAKQMRDLVATMQTNLKGIIIGQERLKTIGKKVGDRLKVFCFPSMYKDIDFEVEILGTFPKSAGRYDGNAVMNMEYVRKALDAYERNTGKRHAMADRCMNLFWVRVRDEEVMKALAETLDKPGRFSSPSVKIERGSSAIASFLDAYKDIIAAARYVLVPACIVVMVLVVAGAISISVRERRPEMAVLKVLGFQPWQVLLLVLGETVFIGALGGGLCTFMVYFGVNAAGGIQFPIAFFGKFYIPHGALMWGPILGSFAALAGSVIPAWSVRSVKVSEVFSKVA